MGIPTLDVNIGQMRSIKHTLLFILALVFIQKSYAAPWDDVVSFAGGVLGYDCDGGKCSDNNECESGWCDGEVTMGCQGICKEKIDDNKECPRRSVIGDGFDESCKSGECLSLLQFYPQKTESYCRPTGNQNESRNSLLFVAPNHF